MLLLYCLFCTACYGSKIFVILKNMRLFGALIMFSFLLLLYVSPAFAVDANGPRFVTCDACGFCPMIDNTVSPATCKVDPTGGPVPGNWGKCVGCLYKDLGPNPTPGDCTTVKIVGDTKLPPTPIPGRQYTMIGCLTSNGGFENNKGTGASSFVQALFDLLVFRITGGIAFLYLMYGAFLILTSQADPERLNYGRRVITGAAVGLIFALSSVFLVNLIGSGILKIPGFAGSP